MSPRVRPLRATAPFAVFALLILGGCTSIGDFGRLQQPLVNDDIHAWVGQEAAAHAGGPVSVNNLTDDERTLRDLAFPLIEPPYDRQRWDAVVLEYGQNRVFRRSLWAFDPAAYYAHLIGPFHRSSSARYNQLIDDMRNDIVRIDPFFSTARRVVDIDQRREKSMQFVSTLSPPERISAMARVGENSLTIAWVHHSLTERCASYRYALEHLTVAEPMPVAAEAERILTELQQQIAGNQIVPLPRFAALARAVRCSPAKINYCTGPRRHCALASARRAIGISPGSGAKARSTISPVLVGNSMISRSAAVTSSSSGTCACCSGVIRSSSMARRPAARSSIA